MDIQRDSDESLSQDSQESEADFIFIEEEEQEYENFPEIQHQWKEVKTARHPIGWEITK